MRCFSGERKRTSIAASVSASARVVLAKSQLSARLRVKVAWSRRVVENTDTATLDGFVRRVVDRDKVELIATDEYRRYRAGVAMRACLITS